MSFYIEGNEGNEEFMKEEFRQEMLNDAAEYRQEIYLETNMRKDYDVFRKYKEDAFTDAIDALRELKRLHEHYDHEFDIRELEDEL